jgi:hypothetical protein
MGVMGNAQIQRLHVLMSNLKKNYLSLLYDKN